MRTVLIIFALAILLDLLLAFPVMWLWNWLMPTIFGLTKITWMQSFGLVLLTALLFNSVEMRAKE